MRGARLKLRADFLISVKVQEAAPGIIDPMESTFESSPVCPATPGAAAAGEGRGRHLVLALSTLGFTVMFAVWLMFGVLAIPIRKEFRMTEIQFGWLTAIAILNGSLWRLLLGILADRYGGRLVLTLLVGFTALPAFLVSRAQSFNELLFYALLVGMAGNAFSVGIAWNSAWFPRRSQGFALGVFGAGNVGASVTKFIGPVLISLVPAAGYLHGWVPGGWRFVPFLYGVLLLATAAAIWLLTPAEDRKPGQGRPLGQMLKPLRQVRVWRFSLYYVVVFGAYVALSVWLPKYYVDVYQLPLQQAALLTALFIFPASLLRPVGGWMADRIGARRVMYWVFGVMLAALLLLSLPNGKIQLFAGDGKTVLWSFQLTMSASLFTTLVFIVGVGMGIGKAAVYKYIPEYFPQDVGAVGGLVGLLGALGGFFLPLLFAYGTKVSGLPQTVFFVLFLITGVSYLWLHWVVMRILRRATPGMAAQFDERQALPSAAQ